MYSNFLYNKQGFRIFDIETWVLKGMRGTRADLQRHIRRNRARYRYEIRNRNINQRNS